VSGFSRTFDNLQRKEAPLTHRIHVLPPPAADAPPIERRADLLQSFLSDAAHVPGGFAAGIAFPKSAGEVAALVKSARRVLPIGAQSSLTGGATPRGEMVISTRALTDVTRPTSRRVRVGAGVRLADLQRVLAAEDLYYPPVPTFDGAFIGGTIATNAAGAATFKYGSARRWVEALSVVLADGSLIEVRRGEVTASPEGWFELEYPSGPSVRVPVPTYVMPDVAKLSAGYFARPGMDLIDLFIGSEGTLGIVIAATLRVIRLPRRSVVLLACDSDGQAAAITAALRREAASSWRGGGALDVSAVEFMDGRSLSVVPDEAFARAGVARPARGAGLLLVQIEITGGEDAALEQMDTLLRAWGVHADPHVALQGDERGAARLFELREAVPASLNTMIAAAKLRVHPDIEKTAGDLIVPFERLEESLALYRETFERCGLEYALWGHVSDGNMHPNVVPRSLEDVHRGKAAILEIARRVVAMGGAPLAEHGVGRSALKQQLLRELYGEGGIEEMRAVKRALDPDWKLAPGVLFPEP
jgi:D-lactate dehydrogenase (cytochrome)